MTIYDLNLIIVLFDIVLTSIKFGYELGRKKSQK